MISSLYFPPYHCTVTRFYGDAQPDLVADQGQQT